MPRLNSLGNWCAGIGGGQISVDGVFVFPYQSGGACWVDDDHVIGQLCAAGSPCLTKTWNRLTGVLVQVAPYGTQNTRARGGVWAIWGDNHGVTTSTGLYYPLSAPGDVGPDGAIAIKTLYQSYGPWDVIEVGATGNDAADFASGKRWRLTAGDASDICLLGSGKAIWKENGAIRSIGLTAPLILTSPFWWLRAIQISGAWWVLYQDATGRLLLHPFDSPDGYIVASGNTYRPDLVSLGGGIVRVVWAVSEGERPGDIAYRDINLTSARVRLGAGASWNIETRPIAGAWYSEALPGATRAYAALIHNVHIETHLGNVALPGGESVLYLRCYEFNGVFWLAGQGAVTDKAWLWNGAAWIDYGSTLGVSPCAFGAGCLYVAKSGSEYLRVNLATSAQTTELAALGSQGFRTIRADGVPIPADASHQSADGQLFDYTEQGDVTIGQGPVQDTIAVFGAARERMTLTHAVITGDCRFVRFNRTVDDLAIATVMDLENPRRAILQWCTRADLHADGSSSGPAFDRALWKLWFIFTATNSMPAGLPGNGYAQVGPIGAQLPEIFLYDLAGVKIAQYVAAELPGQDIETEIAAARVRNPDLQVVAYWTRGNFGGAVPSADWVGVEAYRLVGETVAAFDAAIRAAVARVPKAILIPQVFSSNGTLTADLLSIPSVVAQIARDKLNVVGFLNFSGAGRQTGYQDHPEVWPIWTALFTSNVLPPPAPTPGTPGGPGGPPAPVPFRQARRPSPRARRQVRRSPHRWV